MPTKIEWAEDVWNPTVGCSLIAPGCKNCYAMRDAWRKQAHLNAKIRAAYEGLVQITNGRPAWTGKVRCLPERLEIPLKKRKPTTWFVNSMSDLFHKDVPDDFVDRVFATMALTQRHRYQVLTKRPERMLRWARKQMWGVDGFSEDSWERYLPNVLLGFSASDQATFDSGWEHVRHVAAAGWHTFVSLEPLLGPVDISAAVNALCDVCGHSGALSCGHRLSWIIVGGESGPGARPMHPDWARSLRDQCVGAGVPFFFKQWGEHAPVTVDDRHGRIIPVERTEVWVHLDGTTTNRSAVRDFAWPMQRVGKHAAGRVLDGHTWDQMPEVLR